jgi:hypothetical protein
MVSKYSITTKSTRNTKSTPDYLADKNVNKLPFAIWAIGQRKITYRKQTLIIDRVGYEFIAFGDFIQSQQIRFNWET